MGKALKEIEIELEQKNWPADDNTATFDDPVKEQSFAYGLNFYKLFWIFFISCVLGYIVEIIWCLSRNGYIESRQGLIYGPFSQVYGFGAVLFTLALSKIPKNRDIFLFLGCAALGAIFEYMCSFFQEFLFGTVSWEYSHTQFNLDGRTNLMFATFWGVLGVLLVKVIYPFFSNIIEKIPNKPGLIITRILIIFMSFNMIISALAVARRTQRENNIPAQNIVQKLLDKYYPDEYLSEIYPNMVYRQSN